MSTYPIQQGQSVWDAVINSTGTLTNLDDVLTANGFQDWTYPVVPGQVITIPDGVTMDPNALQQLGQYPVANFSVPGIRALIDALFDELAGNWILTTGFWNDAAPWIDTQKWNDGP